MNALTDLDSRIRVFRQLRSCSNIVRTQLIPAAVAGAVPTSQAFFEFTNAYFKDNVLSGQLVDPWDIMKVGASVEVGGYYDTMIDDLALIISHPSATAGFETLHPRYLRGFSAKFFAAIDANRALRQHGDLDLEFLTIVSFCLQLGHIAKDGNGRTGEDMLVLLAAEADRTLTFSPTGYRGALGGPGFPLLYRQAAERILFLEVLVNFFKFLRLSVPTPISFKTIEILRELNRIGSSVSKSRLDWPDGLGVSIACILEEIAEDPGDYRELFQPSHPYRHYADFLASEMIYFTLCLKNPTQHLPSVKARYPISFSCSQYSLKSALRRTYHPIEDDIGEACDEAVALIEAEKLKLEGRDNKRLKMAIARVETEDAGIGYLLRHELSSLFSIKEKDLIPVQVPSDMTGAQLYEFTRTIVSRTRADQSAEVEEPISSSSLFWMS